VGILLQQLLGMLVERWRARDTGCSWKTAPDDASFRTMGAHLWQISVLPAPDKLSQPHSPKTTAIFKAFMATCSCMIFQSTTKIKTKKNIIFGEGFVNFLFLLPIFGLNITQIF
jgi:hypothetical protein